MLRLPTTGQRVQCGWDTSIGSRGHVSPVNGEIIRGHEQCVGYYPTRKIADKRGMPFDTKYVKLRIIL